MTFSPSHRVGVLLGAAVAVPYSRRLASRIEATNYVYVYWDCNGRDDLSRVADLSVSGAFLETSKPRAVGSSIKVHFLVSEGQIRLDAVIRHVSPGKGLGLKFVALAEEDRSRFTALMKRLRNYS